ncbi:MULTISPECIES: hypothetical protein [unclassified Streptomyces]|uniref:hypothetical protein n=1 Tax=unclassified Streptomyces TaxID=2593676 RepID=UPI0022AF4AF6|nr:MULTISPECIES: hypothetical protein [unclassified Streptomyces]MCZ4097314.1 hypothetical protein [Streptomyces sp. H39-C1]MCZ4120618.1 hypothetical protein [Streptomyces sp. H39-S7]
MSSDPIAVLHAYIATLPDLSGVMVSGTRIGRVRGKPTVVLEGTGGYRVVRRRMDRADVTINVYHSTHTQAAGLASTLRDSLLDDLPGTVVGGAQVLDVAEVSMPFPLPDATSAEFRYVHDIALYLTEASA